MDKKATLQLVYRTSFESPRSVAEVPTSGSYARKVRGLASFGTASAETVAGLCELVEALRRMIKVVDDLVDEDQVRDNRPAFWVVYGTEATIEQAAWYLAKARGLAEDIGQGEAFEIAVKDMALAVELEVSLEDGREVKDPSATWIKIVEKEAAFRRFIAQALGCSEEVQWAMWLDGVAAQVLDDARSELYGKDGRTGNSDQRLGRLTFMRAFQVDANCAEKTGEALKAIAQAILKGEHNVSG